MPEKTRVLITGDSGLLGASLAYSWREKFDIAGASRNGNGVQGTRHFSADLTDQESLNRIIEDAGPAVIIHTAALVSIEDCEKDPERAELFNVKMTENLSEAAKKTEAHVIYISTDAFYQGERNELCTEDYPLTLGSVYARTKREGELPVLDYERGLVLRTNIYGYNLLDKASFGEWILRDLLADKTLTMFTDVLFSPILVNDLASVIESAIDAELYGLFNAGGTGSISKYSFAMKLKEIFDIETGTIMPTSVKDFNFNAWRSTNMAMDNSKIKSALGVEIPDAVDSIRHFKAQYDAGYAKMLKEAAN